MNRKLKRSFLCIACASILFSLTVSLSTIEAQEKVDYSHQQRVWTDFSTGEDHGIHLSFPSLAEISQIGNSRCVSTAIGKGEQFIYFDVDDSFMSDGNFPVVDVTVEYFDDGKDALNIHFDCIDTFYGDNTYAWRGKVIHKQGDQRWKRFTAHLKDAKFANRQKHHRLSLGGGADFRVHNKYDGSNEFIRFVEVRIPYLDVSTQKRGNVFGPEETVIIQARVLNREPAQRSLHLIYEITGYSGNVLERRMVQLTAPGGSVLNQEIKFNPGQRGVYFIDFVLQEGNAIIESAQTSFAVCDEVNVSAEERAASSFGMCVGYEDLLDDDFVSLVADTGIGWVRLEPVWEHLEVEKGKFRWEPYDRMVEAASSKELNLSALLGYQTEWADPTSGSDAALDSFAVYTSKLVTRYKDKIKFWEIWNEEDWMGFWQPKADPVVYTALLKRASVSAKKADPEAKILVGGLTGNYLARGRYKFLTEIYKNGGGPFLDVVAIHPYVAPLSPEQDNNYSLQIEDTMQRMDQFKDAKKRIWITELGWPTGRGTIEEHMANEVNVDPEKQAQYAVRSHIVALSAGSVDKIYWYRFKNPGYDPDISEQNYGLLNADLSPKPSYVAYRVMVSKLTGLNYTGRLNLGEPLRGYVFGDGKRSVKVLWSTGAQKVIELPVTAEAVSVTDMMGNTEQLQADKGKVQVFLTGNPVFVE